MVFYRGLSYCPFDRCRNEIKGLSTWISEIKRVCNRHQSCLQLRLHPLSEIFLESKDTGMDFFQFRDISIVAHFVEELRSTDQKYAWTISRGDSR